MTELGNIKCLPSIKYLHIVSNMFSVTNSLRYSMALLACDHLIGEMTPGSIVTIAISISTTSTMSIVVTVAWVTVCICCGFCFCRAERNIEDAKKNYNLTRKEKLKEKLR